jgi:O-antigen/teichoic acid export membrane protein
MTSLTRNALANAGQTLGSSLLLFFLFREISTQLGVASLGIWSVVLSISSITRLTDFGISLSSTRFVASYLAKDQKEKASKIIESSCVALALIVPLLLIILFPLFNRLAPYFFEADQLVAIYKLMPLLAAAVWGQMISTVAIAGLDGCGLMLQRSGFVLFSQLLMVVLSIKLMPQLGLVGLGIGQLVQGIVLFLPSWFLLRKHLNNLSFFPFKIHISTISEILGYSLNVQFAGIASLFFDPCTKLLFLKFGGADVAAYFEITNQIVMRLRALLVLANQSIIPMATRVWELDPKQLNRFYLDNVRVLLFFSAPLFCLVVVFAGAFEMYFSIQDSSLFFLFLSLSALAWFINTLSSTAYFINIATAEVGINTWSHISIGVLNLMLGLLLGSVWGARGIMLAYAFALILGSLMIMIMSKIRLSFQGMRNWFSGFSWLLMACIVTVSFEIIRNIAGWSVQTTGLKALLIPLTLSCFVFATVWIHPMRKTVIHSLGIRSRFIH